MGTWHASSPSRRLISSKPHSTSTSCSRCTSPCASPPSLPHPQCPFGSASRVLSCSTHGKPPSWHEHAGMQGLADSPDSVFVHVGVPSQGVSGVADPVNQKDFSR